MPFRLRHRLRRTAEFNQVRTQGEKIVGTFFILQLLKINSSDAPPKRLLGVVASRRVGNAVQRNRAKRLLREVFRLTPQALPDHCAVVLTARSSILKASFEEVQREYSRKVALISR